MARQGRCSRWWCGIWAAIVVAVASPGVAAGVPTGEPAPVQPPVQVLILQSLGSDFAPYSTFASKFRTEFAQSVSYPVEFDEISVATAQHGDPSAEVALADYLVALYSERWPDLLVAVGAPAARFGLVHRQRLFSSVPLLVAGGDPRVLTGVTLTDNDAIVPNHIDTAAIVDTIVRVLPGTERLAIVIGRSPVERFWQGEVERQLSPFAGRLELLWWDELSLPEMLRRARQLPPRSAILYGLLLVDGAGVPHSSYEALRKLHEVGAAPIFGTFDTQLGRGIVGGPLVSLTELSQRSATVAARLLAGQPPRANRLPPLAAGTPTFDWRELERWGIRERDLPPGSRVLFRPESPWVTYRRPIAGALAVIAVLTSLVVALALSRTRRRRAEGEVRALSRRLLESHEEERRWLARELHDDVSQRLARLAIDAARIEGGEAAPGDGVDLASVRRELGALSSDLHAMSRRLHPSLLDELGLEEALRAEVARFGQAESIRVELEVESAELALPRDAALCVYRIAQEALTNVARHARATRIDLSLRRDAGGCRLEVRDDGVGFDPRALGAAPRLGLASMRERAKLVGGTLDIRSAPGQGTTVTVRVPAGGGPG